KRRKKLWTIAITHGHDDDQQDQSYKEERFLMCHNCVKPVEISMVYDKVDIEALEPFYSSTKDREPKKRADLALLCHEIIGQHVRDKRVPVRSDFNHDDFEIPAADQSIERTANSAEQIQREKGQQ